MEPKILVFGEILFDIFNNKAEIGGAPFNFAAHFVSLGGKADLISAVGDDDLGKQALEEVEKRGIGQQFITENTFKTGYCQVTLDNGTPSYDLVLGVAYDYIETPAVTEEYDALYFGTLAQRGMDSRQSLYMLLGRPWKEVFYDVNVRAPHYSQGTIEKSIARATILKISREEASVLFPYTTPEEYCKKVLETYPNLKEVVLTLDKDGAMTYNRKSGAVYGPTPTGEVVSTVGAGDSFGACYLYHRLKGHPIKRCLEAANTLAGHVVSHLGAVPDLPEELKKQLQ